MADGEDRLGHFADERLAGTPEEAEAERVESEKFGVEFRALANAWIWCVPEDCVTLEPLKKLPKADRYIIIRRISRRTGRREGSEEAYACRNHSEWVAEAETHLTALHDGKDIRQTDGMPSA